MGFWRPLLTTRETDGHACGPSSADRCHKVVAVAPHTAQSRRQGRRIRGACEATGRPAMAPFPEGLLRVPSLYTPQELRSHRLVPNASEGGGTPGDAEAVWAAPTVAPRGHWGGPLLPITCPTLPPRWGPPSERPGL